MNNFSIGDIVSCYCHLEKKYIKSVIIDIKNGTNGFIHFPGYDKRNDVWIELKSLRPYKEKKNSIDFERPEIYLSDNEILHKDEPNDLLDDFEQVHSNATRIRIIDRVFFGSFEIKTWYYSPYPYPVSQCNDIYICDHCAEYFMSQNALNDHLERNDELKPPGKEIYRKGNISIFELHGRLQKFTCQCLCLLAKLFIDHKTLFYDVEGFLFYVLCECDEKGAHIAAYFSKEIESDIGNILACIVVFPPYQQKGYGRLLISLSYELAKRMKKSGGPERPLSDLGALAFHSFWKDTIFEQLLGLNESFFCIENLVIRTSICYRDLIDTLNKYGFLDPKLKDVNCIHPNWKEILEFFRMKKNSNHKIVDEKYLLWNND